MLDNDVRLHNSVHAINDDDERAESEMVKKYKTKCCDHRDFLSFTFHNPNIQFDVTTRHCSCYLIAYTCNSGLLGSQFKKLVNK